MAKLRQPFVILPDVEHATPTSQIQKQVVQQPPAQAPVEKVNRNDVEIVGKSPINFGKFADKSTAPVLYESASGGTTVGTESTSKKKKRGRPKKSKTLSDGREINSVNATSDRDLTIMESNEPFLDTYDETSTMLKTAIGQIDIITAEVKSDLDAVRKSKALKGKYNYIPQIVGGISSLMSTKVTAIRELNNSITQSHNLEVKRAKEVGAAKQNENNDDKAIMDMYNAFIASPGGMSTPMPNMLDMSSPVDNIIRQTINNSNTGGYEQYQQNITPTLRAMRYEEDQNVKTVVMYEKSTGRKWFDIINVQTGQSIPGVDRPDAMFLEDTAIDLNSGVARNTNIDMTYPIVVVDGGLNSAASSY